MTILATAGVAAGVVFGTGVLAAGRPSSAQLSALAVTFQEWQTPSTPAFPHDPAYHAGDGSVWYTGQRANVIGRLDPATGAFTEWPLPTPSSGPHGLVPDKDGNIWYTGNGAALIGKLDPRTGEITEYKMPDPAARDPHTPIFGLDGMLYFTVQAGNFVGRLDPASGAITLKQPPTANSRPYGIVVASTGLLYFDEFNSNKIGELDPKTMAIKEYTLPDAGARPRRIAVSSDDIVFYTDYARGMLGRLDPKTGTVEEFASPGGSTSRPYAIAITPDGLVWYCETGVATKNMLVAFDPATKQMRTWEVPSGGSTVRHMVVGDADELWLASSGVGKIERATIGRTRP
jgi:virginiamycin B lyase